MTAINTALQAITLGEPQRFANLQITPLLAPSAGTADYLTLSEAQALGLAVVTEVPIVSPEPVVRAAASTPVLII